MSSAYERRTPSDRALVAALAIVAVIVLFGACAKEEPAAPDPTAPGQTEPVLELPSPMYGYVVPPMPAHFNSTLLYIWESTPANNPITDAGATLGRVLFYDRNVSESRSISCGSCHLQEHGFSDPNAMSSGHTGLQTGRNASHLVNQFYVGRHFWDLRAYTLELQVLMPIQDPVEMGMTLAELTDRLQAIDHYPPLFTDAFGDSSITSERISLALAQFVRSMASYQTRYDAGEANAFTDFTPLELDGKALFYNGETRCNHCHMTVNFHNPEARNNGLDLVYTDNGFGEFTGNSAHDGKFKVPSLRNVEVTGPYMHDGRFNTLEEVVEHYNSGIQPHPNLDDRLTVEGVTGGTPIQLGLTAYEKDALVAFMKTLTDAPLLADPRFADPFIY